MRPPPRWIRRAVVDPLYVPVAAVLAVLLVVVLLVSVLCLPFGRRHRALRLTWWALTYLALDVWLVLAGAVLWLRFPRRRRAEDGGAWIGANRRLLQTALVRLMDVSRRSVGFSVDIDPDVPSMRDVRRPVLLLARHAGPGDSFALVWLILDRWGRTPRVVLKDVLLWDPGLDVVLTRLSGCFLPSRSGAGDDNAERVAETASRLVAGDVLLLFPEGGNWTRNRQRRAVRRLWRTGRGRTARQAEARPDVLPPRPAGTAAVLAARRDIDVVVVAHTGLDRLTGVRDIWNAIPVDAEPMRVHWWRVPPSSVPHGEDEDAVAEWLNRQWGRVQHWVAEGGVPSPG